MQGTIFHGMHIYGWELKGHAAMRHMNNGMLGRILVNCEYVFITDFTDGYGTDMSIFLSLNKMNAVAETEMNG